jgi:undecaprenyl-diphosphatase
VDAVQALILGIIQGLTEWLPVSSSGHLVILQEAWGLNVPVLFDVLLHVATAFVVLAFMRKEVAEILRSLGRLVRRWRAGERASAVLREEEGARTAWLIVIGTIPTAMIGFAFRRWIEPLFHSLLAVAVALIITGILLLLTYLAGGGGRRPLNATDALMIGVVQGIAIIPGISRSGTTISAGLFLGADRVRVARYSFLLAVPAIFGAAVAGAFEIGSGSFDIDMLSLIVALASATLFAFLALKLLLMVISRARLYAFAPYCLAVGVAVVVWTLL